MKSLLLATSLVFLMGSCASHSHKKACCKEKEMKCCAKKKGECKDEKCKAKKEDKKEEKKA